MKKKLIVSVCVIVGLVLTSMSLTAGSFKSGSKRSLKIVKAPIKLVQLLPDLKITKIQQGPGAFKLRITVENQGFKESGACVLRLKTVYGKGLYKTVYKSFPALKGIGAGSQNRKTIEIGSSVSVYSTLNVLKIDVFEKVKERNENNNECIADYRLK